MKKKYISLTFILMCIMLSNCNNSKTSSFKTVAYNPNYKKKNFDSLLNTIKKSFAAGLDFSEGLLSNTAFVEIYEHSANYYNDVVNFLNKKEIDNDEAGYCVYAMQSLDVNTYIKLCKIYLTLFDQKKISEGILKLVIAPNFLGRRIVIDNYTDPNVMKILTDYRSDKKISKDFKEMLQNILDGKYNK